MYCCPAAEVTKNHARVASTRPRRYPKGLDADGSAAPGNICPKSSQNQRRLPARTWPKAATDRPVVLAMASAIDCRADCEATWSIVTALCDGFNSTTPNGALVFCRRITPSAIPVVVAHAFGYRTCVRSGD